MKNIKNILFFILFFSCFQVKGQNPCNVTVNSSNIQHIICPDGGAVGSASLNQNYYQNFSWQNLTNGQNYGNGPGVTTVNTLDAGMYVVIASSPYSTCASQQISYSDTFEILMASTSFQFTPTQACPDLCNVAIDVDMALAISSVQYTFSLDNNPIVTLPETFSNQCGGLHFYELFADGISCGVETVSISQFAQMNLATNVVDASCTQSGEATVNITGVGASAINTYCDATPTYSNYTTIDNVVLNGDNNSISNNTSGICDTYDDFTIQFADLTPGNSYNLDLNLGSCHPSINLQDIAKIYIDWNIDGDFDDIDELIGEVLPTQSPSYNTISFSVPNSAVPGESRLRIVAQNSLYQPANQAGSCDYNVSYFGSVEDYGIIVSGSVALPVTYLWSDGQTTQTALNLSPGTYTVGITDANGCTSTDTAIIGGSNNVSVSVSGSQTICYGEIPTQISALGSTSSGTYSWLPANDFIDPNIQSPLFNNTILLTTTYTVNYTDAISGCSASNQVTISVDPLPLVVANVSPSPNVCAGGSITLSGSGNASNFTWNNNVTDNVSFTPPQSWWTNPPAPVLIDYIVTGSSNTSQCVNSDTITITVNPEPTVSISSVPNPACVGDNILLVATPSIPVNLYRFQFNSGSGWTNMTTPVWATSNQAIYSNINQQVSFRVKVRENYGCDASIWSPWTTVPVSIFNNLLIWHN